MKLAALFALALPAICQNLVSPEILPDHKVTFRIAAAKATEVTLTTDWSTGPAEKLSKDDKGVWSVTLGPLAPATYIYSFNVDGIAMADPVNPRIKLRARGSGSLFDVPAETPAVWQSRNVPHGDVQINWHQSSVLSDTRAIWIYTPPGYSKETSRRYPVMYLLHGSNDTPAGWTTAGSINMIMDNLIAEKKAVPMIVVMPFGHATPFGAGRGAAGAVSNTVLYEKYLLTDVMPLVEAKYRINATRENRAIAGQSMGGEQSLAIGFAHMELFGSIGALSPSMPRELAERWAPALADVKGTNAKMKVLWIGCGRQDPSHLTASRKVADTLKEHQIKYVYTETEGAHNYALWQQHMIELAPMLFR